MHGDGLSDNQAILDQLADRLAGVGIGDFSGFIGIEPDLALTAACDGGSQTFLSFEIDPAKETKRGEKEKRSVSDFDLCCFVSVEIFFSPLPVKIARRRRRFLCVSSCLHVGAAPQSSSTN